MKTLSESEKRKREYNIKDIKNLFRLRKEIDNNATKDIRDLFRLKKGNKTMKDEMIRGIKTLSEEEDNYCKPIKVVNFWNNNYIEYESNSDSNKNLSLT